LQLQKVVLKYLDGVERQIQVNLNLDQKPIFLTFFFFFTRGLLFFFGPNTMQNSLLAKWQFSDWLRRGYSEEKKNEVYIRGFLGKNVVFRLKNLVKNVTVLSGGEKVRVYAVSNDCLQKREHYWSWMNQPTLGIWESITALKQLMDGVPRTLVMFTSHVIEFTQNC